MPPILHKKTFQKLTTDELYEMLRVRSKVFMIMTYRCMIIKNNESPCRSQKFVVFLQKYPFGREQACQ